MSQKKKGQACPYSKPPFIQLTTLQAAGKCLAAWGHGKSLRVDHFVPRKVDFASATSQYLLWFFSVEISTNVD